MIMLDMLKGLDCPPHGDVVSGLILTETRTRGSHLLNQD
jgi:hypothetical protein